MYRTEVFMDEELHTSAKNPATENHEMSFAQAVKVFYYENEKWAGIYINYMERWGDNGLGKWGNARQIPATRVNEWLMGVLPEWFADEVRAAIHEAIIYSQSPAARQLSA